MSFRIALCGWLAAAMLGSLAAPAAAADTPARPNVLFVITDDQRWDTIAALGNPEIITPTTDALVARGFVFHNTYCMGSMIGAVCRPSRTMLLTGRSLWRIPAANTRNGPPTLGGVFRQAGYATLFVGKRGNSYEPGHNDFETVVYNNPAHPARAAQSQFTADQAIAWLRKQAADQPFCIYLGPNVPHDPRAAPDRFHRLYDAEKITLSANFMPEHPFDNGELRVRDELLAPHPRTRAEMRQHLADYYATITCFDHHLGRVLEELKTLGRYENTLIVFTSDHGLAVGGRHGLMGKQNLYEHNKPPLVLAGPGIPAGQSSAALVYLYDLLPTLCDAAGLATPATCEGRSLLPIVRGEQQQVRATLFGAYRDCQRMIRDERWKLIHYRAGDQRNVQLFDLRSDPDELVNLADDPRHAAERARLEKLLAAARREYDDPSDFDAASPAARP